MIEQHYKTPEGKVDAPFIYVFNANSLALGSSPRGLVVPIQENDFLLRSVVGINTAAQDWAYYNPSDSPAMGSGDVATSGVAAALIATSPRYTVVPEKFYPANSQIKFDLGTVAPLANGDGNDIALIGFQGVKRLGQGQDGWTTYKTGYEYYEAPFSYEITVAINFFLSAGAAPRSFEVPITDNDFELQKIAICETTTGGEAALPADPFWIDLKDPSGYQSLSTAPMSPRWLNYFQGGNFFSCFPVPALVYPVNGRIKFDVTSLLNAAGGTRNFQISFQGVERRPC